MLVNGEVLADIAESQREYFSESPLTAPLGARDYLLGEIAVKCSQDLELQRSMHAKAKIDNKSDILEIRVDKSTVEELIEEVATNDGLSAEDFMRAYVGIGVANLLLAARLPRRPTAVKKFLHAISEEPHGLYNQAIDLPIFDEPGRLETIQDIITSEAEKLARVNGLRLATGTFIEVQPDAREMREKVQASFQPQLDAMFTGKSMYLKTVGLFDVHDKDAADMYADNVAETLALALPMPAKEVKGLIKFYR